MRHLRPLRFQTSAQYGAWTWTNYFATELEAWDHLCDIAEDNGRAPDHATITQLPEE